MKNLFLSLAVIATLTVVSCKEKAAEAEATEAGVEAVDSTAEAATEAVDSTAAAGTEAVEAAGASATEEVKK